MGFCNPVTIVPRITVSQRNIVLLHLYAKEQLLHVIVPRITVSIGNIMENKRKKWTHQEEVTDSLVKAREKRKWQLAFRRYILEKQSTRQYAPFMGLDIETYRNYIELQFTGGLSWSNFGKSWQFEHIIPMSFFDFSNHEDMALCWNFINIRVEPLEKEGVNSKNILAAKSYFEKLYQKTGYDMCQKMVEKINRLAENGMPLEGEIAGFISSHNARIQKITTLTADEMVELNKGAFLEDILLEREIIRKFG